MCGATSAQTNLQNEQAEYYATTMQQQQQVYGQDQEILSAMKSAYQPILAAGPDQKGFSDEEETDLNSAATEGTATDYAQAEKALGEAQDAEGGGNIVAPSGANEQESAELAASAANQESGEKEQIQQADYAQGYDEWKTAGAGLDSTAGLLDPVGYSGAATSAGSAAGTTANQIAQENNSWVNAALGAAGGIAGAVIGENPGGIFG